jgi:hypothetical protein
VFLGLEPAGFGVSRSGPGPSGAWCGMAHVIQKRNGYGCL